MNNKNLRDLIYNLYTSSLSIAEKAEIAKWLNSKEAEIDSMNTWKDVSNNIDQDLKNEIWDHIKDNTIESHRSSNIISPVNKYSFLKIAAVVAIILCSLITSYIVYDNNITNERLSENIYSFQMEPGQKGSLRLSDGTIIHLNSDSKISFASNYNTQDRTVNLEGEAYFEVAKNPNKKFIVTCNGLQVEALGTKFNVKAYAADNTITTTLSEGKVKVSSEKQNVILLPNDVATYNLKENRITASTVADVSVANFWMSDHIVFESESLASISRTIERMYNVKIKITDKKLGNIKFTGTIQNNSLNNIMYVISLTYPISYTVNDSIITLSPSYN